jgi:hypothetical protein
VAHGYLLVDLDVVLIDVVGRSGRSVPVVDLATTGADNIRCRPVFGDVCGDSIYPVLRDDIAREWDRWKVVAAD